SSARGWIERLCQGSGACLMDLKILVENPLEMHYVVVEITDVNDHSPVFPEQQQTLEIAEHTLPGRRFQLHSARDPDAGMNSIRSYTLTTNEHFDIDIRQGDEDKIPFLVLKKSLDREQKHRHSLIVTAVDGGKPVKSGILNVSVIVLDINDNRPIFSQEIYQIHIKENIAVGTSIFKINATDPDEGTNGEISYSLVKTLRKSVYDIFELDKITGEIRVKGLVDYEENDIYKLDVEASDRGTPPLTGESRVIIKVIDVNDNPPEIEVTSLTNTVQEDSKPGTVISLLSVTDKDSGVNGKVRTSLTSDGPFELKPSFKENIYSVVTKGVLDREEVTVYEVTIKANDCGETPMSTFKTFTIIISDVNDNKPQFSQNPYHFYVVENNIAGKPVFSIFATDKDTNDNAVVSYHILREGNQKNIMTFLNVNPDNGEISALKSFDFEAVKTFQFQVVATDSGTPSLSSNVTVHVFILDQNDNAPVILYPVSSNGSAEGVEEIPRNVHAGHLVTKVRAYDADIGYNGWLLFSLQEVSDHSLFGLDRYTGQIRTLPPGMWNLSWFTVFLATVLLAQREALAQIRYVTPEEVREGTVVGNVAKDFGLDVASLTDRRFRVVSGGSDAIFEVNQSNGALYVDNKIDREELCPGSGTCLIELKILVENPLEIHYVVVEITDVNDHSPSFPEKHQTFEIAEQTLPGKRFQLHTARDPDAGINSIRTYTLTANEHFDLNIRQIDAKKIPFLVLKKSLDREQRNKHMLLVTAVDGGKPPRSATLNVSIIVLDINDNRPIFSQEVYEMSVKENIPVGTSVFRMNATDHDEGINGEVEYSLGKTLSPQEYNIFELDKLTGVIVIKGLVDYEENDVYGLDVEASDKGTPPLSGECRLVIKIIDVNDNSPEIDVTSLSNTVSENSKPGTVVSLLSVKDKDSGVNGKIISSIINDVPFELKPSYQENTYSIITKGLLDREKVSHYEIIIKATDCGEPPLSAFKTVSIHVADVNDNSPHFDINPLRFYLDENNIAGKSIFSVSATDNDINDNAVIAYHLVRDGSQKDITSFLNINSENGEISALKSFDFEAVKTFQFQVVATDSGTPSLSSNVTVHVFILDQNDNAPVILYPVSSNGSAEGVILAKVSAIDPDEGDNGKIEYSLSKALARKVYDIFELNHLSGEIKLKQSLDYEESDIYKLDIEASDKGTPPLIGRCRVVVKIKDVNDNSPEIEITSLTNKVFEDSKPGTVISLISVTDRDSGLNGKIILQIMNDVPFELKPSYKENIYSLMTKEKLDREEVSFYEIKLQASDCGEQPLSTVKTLGIQIIDINDNSPQFDRNKLHFYLMENNVAGASIFSLTASDKDVNENSAVSYHIVRGGSETDMTSFLNINSDNGQISALKSFDFEAVKTFQFQVVATDSGTPSLSSNVTVHLFILDQNDNAPVILYPVSSNGSAEGVEEIPRNVHAGHLVTKVRAYDADIGYNGWLLFSLQEVSDHSLFGLDRYTGQIRTLRSFTETDEAEHKLLILVKDNGNASLSATATVMVKVVEPKEAFAASDVQSAAKDDEDSDVTFYLMITLGAVSLLFVISIIVLIAMQCSKSTDYTSKYLQEPNYDGTLCHSIQYRSGDKRYMLVGPRMSIGSTIVPGSHANTLVLPDRRRTSEEVRHVQAFPLCAELSFL
uniref:Si:ch73-379j16.2 n=1 Tax=Gouania willdenowi TaxID=441366 RepID=A0A8C5DR20_GOUWI